MSSDPEISVVMPVFNAEPYVAEAVQSILDQSFEDFELLLVNDASTDKSLDVIKSFSDPRIRIIENEERLKLSGALNRGMSEAKGEYIARMDSDDRAHASRFEKQAAFLDAHPDIGILGTWVKSFGGAQEEVFKYPETPNEVNSFALFHCPFAHPTVMFRRNLFQENGLVYDGSYYPTEDFELWSRALLITHGANLQEVLLDYRVHAGSMTQSDWSNMDEKAVAVLKQQLNHAGLEVKPEQVAMHRRIAMAHGFNSREELDQAEQWLLKVVEAAPDTRQTASDAWYRNLMASGALGWLRFVRFLDSPLGHGPGRIGRSLTLAGSVMKRAGRSR